MTTQTAPRFPVRTRVRIDTGGLEDLEFHGEFGAVSNICQTYDGKYAYEVCLDATGLCSVFMEEELVPAEYALEAAVTGGFASY